MNFVALITVAAVVFIAELPDKSMFASLVLSTRFPKPYVWMGAAAAFLVHVIIAVTAGSILSLLPQRIVDFVVAALFLVGAALLFFGKNEDEAKFKDEKEVAETERSKTFVKVFTTSFIVIFLGEWGDLTQIIVANYAAKYHSPLSVGIGATIGLWAVSGLGILLGAKLLKRVPAKLLQTITGIILLIFAGISLIAGIRA